MLHAQQRLSPRFNTAWVVVTWHLDVRHRQHCRLVGAAGQERLEKHALIVAVLGHLLQRLVQVWLTGRAMAD